MYVLHFLGVIPIVGKTETKSPSFVHLLVHPSMTLSMLKVSCCIQQWQDQMHSMPLGPLASASLMSYACSLTSILDVVDLHIFKDLLGLQIFKYTSCLVFDMYRKLKKFFYMHHIFIMLCLLFVKCKICISFSSLFVFLS